MYVRIILVTIVAMVAFFISSCTREPFSGTSPDARPLNYYKSDTFAFIFNWEKDGSGYYLNQGDTIKWDKYQNIID